MKPLNVLIAEDEPITAGLLEYLVQQEGHSVCGIVDQGAKVLELAHTLQPDVILMDIHLADNLSGIATTEELLQQVDMPVIIISATDSQEELKKIAKCGALGFIKKPVSPEELQVNLHIVTRHNEVMRNLKTSELMHRNIFDNAAVGIYVCDRTGRYVASNQAYAKMLGYLGPAELIRMVFSIDEQVYAEEDRRKEFLAQMEAGHVLNDIESQVYGKDGDMLWISEHLTPSFDEDGKLTHYEGVVINISDKKKAENDRNVAYTMLHTTMNAISEYLVVTDLDGYIIFSNKAFEDEVASSVDLGETLSFEDSDGCPLAKFREELSTKQLPEYQVRGYCRIPGHNRLLHIGISRYLSPTEEVIGMVFVMHPFSERIGTEESSATGNI